MHAVPGGEFGVGEQAVGVEPVGVAGQVVTAARFEDDAGCEGLAVAGAVTGGVERVGGFGVGVGVEEPVERGEGVGVGSAELPGFRRDRDGEAVGLPAAEADVQVDVVGLCRVTSSTRRRTTRLRSRCGVSGFDHRVGKSVARERILALASSVRVLAAAVLARS